MGICGIKANASAAALAEAALEVANPETTAVGLVLHCPNLAGEGCSAGLGTGVLLVVAGPTDLPLAAVISAACTCKLMSKVDAYVFVSV